MDAGEYTEKTQHDLEWGVLLDRIAGRCRGELAVARARQLRPLAELEDARTRGELVGQALGLGERGVHLPVRSIMDLEPWLGRVRRGGSGTGRELAELRVVLEAARELRLFAVEHRHAHPLLAATLHTDPALEKLERRIGVCIADDGSISDEASSELRRARRRVEDVRRELVGRLRQLMARYASVLQDEYYAERDGRYVLPVRADAHYRVGGIVHGSSASGATLYVEPEELMATGNQLRLAEAEVEREEARVLAELSSATFEQLGSIEQAVHVCTEADLLAALARWAADTQSVSLLPEREPVLELLAIRHPLLLGLDAPVVPSDLRLEAGQVLVISGPNAGGKTVALKCLGLAAWMARAGIPVPADPGSRVGFFEPVLTDVGDDQSLARSLSTFSAHVAHLRDFLELCGSQTLVLLDEITAGTDPQEGAALATALLEALVDRGAAIAVTTHYERLKLIATEDERFLNASVGFDLENLSPTFRVTQGVPGPSSALAVAERFGVPLAVIERARALLPEQSGRLEELLQSLQSERAKLEEARSQAEQEARSQARLVADLEAERRRAREQEQQRLVREGRELTAEVQRARSQLRAARERLQPSTPRGELRDAERLVDEAARQVSIGGPLTERLSRGKRPQFPPARSADLRPGVRIYLPRLAAHGEVLEAPVRGQLRVQVGSLKLQAKVGDLQLAPAAARAPSAGRKKRASTPSELETRSAFVPVRTSDNTLDLRGQRVEEGLEAVDAFLDRLLRMGEAGGFVLHGHGTGALKSAVRAHLAASSYVERSGPADSEDGGDAFTIFWTRA